MCLTHRVLYPTCEDFFFFNHTPCICLSFYLGDFRDVELCDLAG